VVTKEVVEGGAIREKEAPRELAREGREVARNRGWLSGGRSWAGLINAFFLFSNTSTAGRRMVADNLMALLMRGPSSYSTRLWRRRRWFNYGTDANAPVGYVMRQLDVEALASSSSSSSSSSSGGGGGNNSSRQRLY